jgi:serine/threonine protein kinase/Tol biopolymer transport system component
VIGQTISHYRILQKLGEGGMGVVYRARDTKLDRDVALKFLPSHVSATKEVAARFLQEARAAAALNHANICTIYGVEEHDDADGPSGSKRMFIAMEYIDGGTLREKLPLPGIAEAASVASQVGEALQEAHSKGIVHRDVKADNVMLTSKGQVKVMDFGLAKLKGSLKLTKTSSTVGTLGYMAPEQIGGGEVDARSDLFSFGVLIFEMLTGRLPFRGEHEAAMVYSIMNEQPEPLSKFLPDAPPELGFLISKALEKDPADRYQSAAEMLVDLRRLKKSTTRISRAYSVPPPTDAGGVPSSSMNRPAVSATGYAAGSSADVSLKIKAQLVLLGSFLIVSAVATAYFLLRTDDRAVVSAANVKMSRLTSDGNAGAATISPDGKYVIYVKGQPGEFGLWIRQVATATEIQVLPPSDIQVRGSTFSNDGNYVYYTASLPSAPVPSVYRTPVIGGTQPRKIIENVESPVTLSPDDSRIAFFRGFPETGEEALFVANADGSGERKLASRDGKNYFFLGRGTAPAWSPDGNVIACPAGSTVAGLSIELMTVPLDGSKERIVTRQNWQDLGRVAWFHDGRGLLVCANRSGDPTQIFYVSYPDGAVSKITNDLLEYGPTSLSITTNATAIVSAQSQASSNIVLAPGGAAAAAVEFTHGATRLDGTGGLAWAAGERIVFTSATGGRVNLWIAGKNGGDARQLTFNSVSAFAPATAPGGQTIYFVSRQDSLPCIWRVNADGGEPARVTFTEDYNPDVSPDGKWLLFDSYRGGSHSIWKQRIDVTEPATIFRQGGNSARFSPDGKLVACWAHDAKEGRYRLAVHAFPSGEPAGIADFPNSAGDAWFTWAPDGRTIHFIDSRKGVSNIWSCDYRTGAFQQVTNFTSGRIFRFAWSPDGKTLALARGQTTSDIVLLTITK